MKILVINGDCIQVNTSANLCHLAYLRGLTDAGHEVTLLSADGRDYTLDPAMKIPEGVKQHTYYGVSLYEKLSLRKRGQGQMAARTTRPSGEKRKLTVKQKVFRSVKKAVLASYGVHGIYSTFVRKAMAFQSDKVYDYMISLSTPVTSHLIAHRLREAGKVNCRHWIQVWEDPWYSDAYDFNKRKEVFLEERRLLSFAERICYVSPITLQNQKRLFPESKEKMYWEPLPAYYSAAKEEPGSAGKAFGYFGDYGMPARNLKHFYEAARNTKIDVTICGSSNISLASTDTIQIYPRLTLEKLKPFEDRTNILVFLCNRKGGQIPGKIYQYAATYKTILFILDGTEDEKRVIRNYFAPFNRFVFCENTVEDIERAIRRIQNDEYGDVTNRPLDDFEPVKIIQRILEEGAR